MEFTMKDAYSFHSSSEDLQEYYDRCFHAYERIFKRTGLSNVVSVASDTGMMGRAIANGFVAICSSGEDTIACCKSCDYKASADVAKGKTVPESAPVMALQKVHTPGMSTINDVASFLKIPASQTAKAVFFQSDRDDKPVFVIIRGDLEVNEFKLAKLIGVKPEKADDDTIIKIGAVAGYASPLGIDKTKCHIICDHSIRSSSNLACGANEKDFHYINFNLSRDLPEVETVDIATVREGDLCPHCKDYLTLKRGIEVGKIFQLGTKYTKSMNMQYLDEHGSSQTPFMGCYGIGIGRLMATVLELHHDDWGPKWPMSIAPWQVHICALKYSNDSVAKATNKLNQLLSDNHVEVLVDDRNERPGVQFADADLLGIPIRLIVSDVNLKDGLVELKLRGSRDKETVLVEDVAERVKEIIDRELVC
jgi:prolyl-tRNA synthetase